MPGPAPTRGNARIKQRNANKRRDPSKPTKQQTKSALLHPPLKPQPTVRALNRAEKRALLKPWRPQRNDRDLKRKANHLARRRLEKAARAERMEQAVA